MGRRIARAQANARVFTAADAWEGAADRIENAPAVDAEPVRHGKWVWNNDAIDWGIGAWVCSECGGRNENIHAAKPGTVKAYTNPYIYAGTKFCPNCGARMIQGGAE